MAGRIPLATVTNDTVDELFAEVAVNDNGGDNPDNDYVVRDSNQNVVFRYDESAGAWTLEGVDLDAGGNDISNVGSVSTDEINTNTEYVASASELQTALDSVRDAGGGTVEVLESCNGESVSGPILVGPDTKLTAQSGQVRINITGSNPGLKVQEADGTHAAGSRTTQVENVEIGGLYLDGGDTATKGMHLFGLQSSKIGEVRVQNFVNEGGHISGESFDGGGVYNCNLGHIHSEFNGVGMRIEDNGRGVNSNVNTEFHIIRSDAQNLIVEGDGLEPHGNEFWVQSHNANWDGTARPGVEILSCENNHLFGWWGENNAGNVGVRVGDSGSGTANRNTLLGRVGFDHMSFDAGCDKNYCFPTWFIGDSNASGVRTFTFNADDGAKSDTQPFVILQAPSATNDVANVGLNPTGNWDTDTNGNYRGISTQLKSYDGTNHEVADIPIHAFVVHTGR